MSHYRYKLSGGSDLYGIIYNTTVPIAMGDELKIPVTSHGKFNGHQIWRVKRINRSLARFIGDKSVVTEMNDSTLIDVSMEFISAWR